MNTGSLATDRNLGAAGSDESYTIDDEGGSAATGETIKVTAFGQSQEFTGVNRIVDDASGAGGDESLVVDPGVQVPVVFIGGPNNNTFVDNGSGYAVAYGGGSDDTTDDVNVLGVGPSVSSTLLVGGPAFNAITDLSSPPTYLVGVPAIIRSKAARATTRSTGTHPSPLP